MPRGARARSAANDLLQSGDGEVWAKFSAVSVFAGDCIVIPAGASVVGALEDFFWGRALRIHRQDDEASYLAIPMSSSWSAASYRRHHKHSGNAPKFSQNCHLGAERPCPIGVVLTLL